MKKKINSIRKNKLINFQTMKILMQILNNKTNKNYIIKCRSSHRMMRMMNKMFRMQTRMRIRMIRNFIVNFLKPCKTKKLIQKMMIPRNNQPIKHLGAAILPRIYPK